MAESFGNKIYRLEKLMNEALECNFLEQAKKIDDVIKISKKAIGSGKKNKIVDNFLKHVKT